MKFAEPLWLLAGLLTCAALAWAWRRYDVRQRSALASFASSHLREQLTASFSIARRNWKRGLFLAAVGCLFVALARPEAGFRWEEIKRRGIEVMFAVDTSRSMLTPDVKPDRLTRAKLAVDDFANHLDGDGTGLIAFAGEAFLQCPITLDSDAFHESLDALDTGIIPRGGTDIASAIREAQAALQNRPGKDKILVLLTDGEDLEGNALDAAKAAAKAGMKIYTVGVGTANGDLIPIPADQGGGFVKDADGQYVKSHLDEAGLKAIAEATGGFYAPLGSEGQGLETIYKEALAPLSKHDLASRRQKVYTERFQWPLAASLAFLLTSTLIGTRRRAARHKAATVQVTEKAWPKLVTQSAAVALGLLLLNPFNHAKASPAAAEKAYQKGDFAAAEREYAEAAQHNPKKPDLIFNVGTAEYKAGQFQQAAEAFKKSAASEPSAAPKRLAAQEDAYYNLGDALYRVGQKTEQSNPQQTIQDWEQAVKTYETALQLRAGDADAKFNRDFVKQKLEQLKKQQQQKQNEQKQKQDQKDKNQQNQSAPNNQQNKDQKQNDKKQGGQGSEAKNQQNKDQQQANNGSKPQPQPQQQQQKSASGDQHKDQTAQNDDSQREPGQMSKAEARALLDSLKDEQQRLPAAPVARNTDTVQQQDQPLKDW
jgi:Ca-activated chloride channel family protein